MPLHQVFANPGDNARCKVHEFSQFPKEVSQLTVPGWIDQDGNVPADQRTGGIVSYDPVHRSNPKN
jgi:hypothetical protein